MKGGAARSLVWFFWEKLFFARTFRASKPIYQKKKGCRQPFFRVPLKLLN